MIAPVISIKRARARAKRVAGFDHEIMSARVEGGRVWVRFSCPTDSFSLSADQARFWSEAFATLADSLAGT